MIEIDPISLLVTTDTDISMAELEKRLEKEGYTLNFLTYPQNEVLLADVLRERRPNLYGAVYGGIEERCGQIRLAQPDGSVFRNVLTPRSAAGPSLKKMAIGVGDALGVPYQATLRLFFRPEIKKMACVVFATHEHLDVYREVLKKKSLKVPLLHLLSPELARRMVGESVGLQPALGLLLWGEKRWVETCWEELQELSQGNQGRWMEWESLSSQKEYSESLRREALHGLEEGARVVPAAFSETHRKWAERVLAL